MGHTNSNTSVVRLQSRAITMIFVHALFLLRYISERIKFQFLNAVYTSAFPLLHIGRSFSSMKSLNNRRNPQFKEKIARSLKVCSEENPIPTNLQLAFRRAHCSKYVFHHPEMVFYPDASVIELYACQKQPAKLK